MSSGVRVSFGEADGLGGVSAIAVVDEIDVASIKREENFRVISRIFAVVD